MEECRLEVNGIGLHCVRAGEGERLVILLHGFPEFWLSWRSQLEDLSAAGFSVIAPDLRGYNLSQKPDRVEDYRIERLTGDVEGIIQAMGRRTAVVAGHDWGGVIAWATAMRHPARVDRLIILNAPHPAAFFREVRKPMQLLRSSYMLYFQLPWLPEITLKAFRFAALRWIWRRDPRRAGAFPPQDVERYIEALSRPGALRSAIHYYRALGRRRRSEHQRQLRTIDCPTLLIWGECDRYLGLPLTKGLERWVPELRVETIPDCSHWVQAEQPQTVSRLMLDFLRKDSP